MLNYTCTITNNAQIHNFIWHEILEAFIDICVYFNCKLGITLGLRETGVAATLNSVRLARC
jgi:hypothetical protein